MKTPFFPYLEALFFPARFRQKLQQLGQSSPGFSLELLKRKYNSFFPVYSRLPFPHQQRCLPSLIKLRETIESCLQTEKEVEQLLAFFPRTGSFKRQKLHYLKISRLCHQLPSPSQQKYYPQLLHLREQLERKI